MSPIKPPLAREDWSPRHGLTKLTCEQIGDNGFTITLDFHASRLWIELDRWQVHRLLDWLLTKPGDLGYSRIFTVPSERAGSGALLTLVRDSAPRPGLDLVITVWREQDLNPRHHRELTMIPSLFCDVAGWLSEASGYNERERTESAR